MDLALLWLVVYSCGFLLPSAPLYTKRLPERPLSAKADVQTVSPERAERPTVILPSVVVFGGGCAVGALPHLNITTSRAAPAGS
jgi:hypothetical protein